MKLKIILVISALLMTSTIALQNIRGIETVQVGNTSAKVETWAEQTWQDKWIGTGFWQTRTLYTVTPQTANKSTVYENRRFLTSASNNTTVNQNVSYSYTTKTGHSVPADVKAKSTHFEAAVGYKFSYEKSETYSASLTVPPRKTYSIYQSDARILQQYTTYKKQPQRANNLTATSWVNNGSATTSLPLIKQYNGAHFDFQ